MREWMNLTLIKPKSLVKGFGTNRIRYCRWANREWNVDYNLDPMANMD